MTDVNLFLVEDGGEIAIQGGQVELSDGFESAVILSLFGGNELDSGIQADDPRQWWGNFDEPDPARHYRSETQHLLRSIPAIPANLRRVEDAAGRDLAWMAGTVADGVLAEASIPSPKTIDLLIRIQLTNGSVFERSYRRPWRVTTP